MGSVHSTVGGSALKHQRKKREMARLKRLLSWAELSGLAEARSKVVATDRVSGPTNSQANLRLFGRPEGSEELTLYREALEVTAAIAGDGEGPMIPVKHRRDQ